MWLRGFLPAALVAAATPLSLRQIVTYQTTPTPSSFPRNIGIIYGTVAVVWGPGRGRPGTITFGAFFGDGWHVVRSDTTPWHWQRPRWLGNQVFIPLWLISLTLAVPPTAMAIRRRRRSLQSPALIPCPTCGYERTGLAPDQPCPECGTPSSSRTPLAAKP